MNDVDEIALEYRLEENLTLHPPTGYHRVERWAVSVVAVGRPADEPRVEIGSANVIVFNLAPGADIRDLADRASGTWIDPDDGGQRPESHVLLLDRVWLRPASRGQGLGPIIAAAAIERLGRGCHLATCYPAPFEDVDEAPEEREQAVEALGRIWAKVGFTRWNGGVWMLDLRANDVHATLAALLADRRSTLVLSGDRTRP